MSKGNVSIDKLLLQIYGSETWPMTVKYQVEVRTWRSSHITCSRNIFRRSGRQPPSFYSNENKQLLRPVTMTCGNPALLQQHAALPSLH